MHLGKPLDHLLRHVLWSKWLQRAEELMEEQHQAGLDFARIRIPPILGGSL